MVKIEMPAAAKLIISELEKNGFEAYIVGGCVRDYILGRTPNDWDICTSAKPNDVINIFSQDYHVIETGLKHGTVTVAINKIPYEVTTFRIDGEYTDSRHPDSIEFTGDITKDLARRDFTINAMAYNDKIGIVDVFGGMADCENKIIRCVGNAKKRFEEDALRILRAVRFASQLGFGIEQDTQKEIHALKQSLVHISAERINAEFCKIITGKCACTILNEYKSVFAEIIPDIQPMFRFEQHNFHHIYDVWGHTLKALEQAPPDLTIRLAVFFHDIAKPLCFSKSDDGMGHFYGHAKISADMTRKILADLKFDNDTIKNVTELIYYHDSEIMPENKYVKRWLGKIGEVQFKRLLNVKRCDTRGLAPQFIEERLEKFDYIEKLAEEVLSKQECFSMKSLNINGRDLIKLGMTPGKRMGEILNTLLNRVVDGEIPNDRNTLIREAKKLI